MNERRRMLLYFCAVIAFFAAFTLLTGTPATLVTDKRSLEGFDYASGIAYITDQCYDWYPNHLYEPADFAAGNIEKSAEIKAEEGAQYATYRMVIALEPGKVYGLSGYSATSAQKIWIDGTLYSSVGTPGETMESTSPKTDFYVFYFPSYGQTEIIVQRSNFYHANDGRLFPQYLGHQTRITALIAQIWVRGAVSVGSMIMSALFFFGLFLFFKERLNFLWFAISSALIAFRTLIADHYLIMRLFPDLTLEVSLRLEYLSTIGFFSFFFLYVNRMFERKMSRVSNRFGLFIAGSSLFVVIFFPSTVYTKFLPYMQIGAVIYVFANVAALIRHVAREKSKRGSEYILLLLGTLAYAGFAILDLARYSYMWSSFRAAALALFNLAGNDYSGGYEDLNLMQTGAIIFVFANTLALALNFARTETELDEIKQRDREMAQSNRMLERLNRVKTDFLSNISHEMRTPLTIIGGYAGLTLRQIRMKKVDARTEENLDAIQREALRLGNLVEQLKAVAVEKERKRPLMAWDMALLFRRAADFCVPICQTNENKIVFSTSPEEIELNVDAEAIFQVLFNLITNANRHMKHGVIALSATERNGAVAIEVRDEGGGIDPAVLGAVFERGVSGDGGTGLGLSICKEIIEEHGGTITLKSTLNKGTTALITLPGTLEAKEG